MEAEELGKLQEAAQQCVDLWADILGMKQWNIVAVVDDDMERKELPELEYDTDIASAKITLVTGDVWRTLFKDYWAPYNMEVHLIAQLLRLFFESSGDFCQGWKIYFMARRLHDLKNRGDMLQQMMEEANKQETPAPPEDIKEPVDAVVVEDEEK